MNRGLGLVALVVEDYDEAIAFFCGKLGFDLLEDTPRTPQKRWVRIAPDKHSSTSILLARADNESQRASIGNQTGGRVGFFLQTDDFHRDHAKFLSEGVHFEESPRVESYGTVAVFTDLCGNRWDLIEYRS